MAKRQGSSGKKLNGKEKRFTTAGDFESMRFTFSTGANFTAVKTRCYVTLLDPVARSRGDPGPRPCLGAPASLGGFLEMFSRYQQWAEYEDELYCEEDEGDSCLSESDSELEFQLYSQLHYNMGLQEVQGDTGHEGPEEEPLQPGRGAPPAPPAPVEVITIDSGPDAITISDSTEDEDSVCALKPRQSRPRCRVNGKGPRPSALLAPQTSRSEKVRNVMEEVVVLYSDSDESSGSVMPFVEDPDSDSDSDGLESWMILGRDREEGDQDIQLNLSAEGRGRMPAFSENVKDGEGQLHWAISDRDKELSACVRVQAQIINKDVTPRRLSNRYYTNKTVTCRNCNKLGHLSKNCPTPKSHWVKFCPNRPCSNCFVPGHSYDTCLERPYWHKRCHRCTMAGHFANACPEIWRQYHLTIAGGPPVKAVHPQASRSPAYCYNCSKKGHFGHECSERRMFNGTYPTLPLICSYDTLQDIRCRERWAQKRAQELQEAGLIESTEAPHTARPPQKKQKTYPKNTFPPHTPATHVPKRRIAHTPKHHPRTTPGPNTHTRGQQGMCTPAQKATPPLQNTFTPQLQGKKKKKKKKKKNLIVLDDDNFPRGSPLTQNERRSGMLFGSGKKLKKKNQAQKRARKAAGSWDGGAPDENLFAIKQRKRSR
ncbi:hypothetical protein P4O66_012470 [Electrophorus voltai]|uniref:Zinc finger CCHC domain-containing protein 7 n=1 Tax=Electrophorus voltai TaxID=2609070 RepID=A0AAD8Z4T1_9TELE|nr:hypothetical protein P4O66_012470 [Electrophorus voltai]